MREWIEWKGGDRPVSGDTEIRAKLSNGLLDTCRADEFAWAENEDRWHVVAYRIVGKVAPEDADIPIPAPVTTGQVWRHQTDNTKPSNPKDIVGIRKAPMSTVSAPVLAEIGVGMLEGAAKYGRHNYRIVGVRSSVYYDATMRHLMSWWEGEDIDPESGMSHITKAITSLVVLRDSQIQGTVTDDRAPRSAEFYPALNKLAGEIIDRHADKSPRHYTIADEVAK